MKVLLINNCHYLRGGSESVYFGTADLLVQSGHDVVFLSIENQDNIHTTIREFFVKKVTGLNKIIYFFNNRNAIPLIEEIIEKEKPDIAHAHLLWGGITASIIPILHKHNIPIVHTAHDYRLVCPAYLLKDGKGQQCERCKGGHYYQCALHCCSKGNAAESFIMTLEMYYRNTKFKPLNLIDGFIFVSNFSKNMHIEFEPRFKNVNSLVLYNCPTNICNDYLGNNIDAFDSYYLYYGRLSSEKGVSTLIKAIKRFPHLKLKIVGNGPQENELKSYVEDNQIKNVKFIGHKKGRELFDIVARAKFVCVTSECYENNPMTIVESYTMGVPVIGSAIGGITEIVINDETGYTFESGNVNSLVEALTRASSINKEEYALLKRRAHIFSQKNFCREKNIEKLLSFYNEVKKTYREH